MKDCPFCGKRLLEIPKSMLLKKIDNRITLSDIQVVCVKCGATGGTGWNEQEAIEKWNRRA